MSVTEYFTRTTVAACNLGPFESRWHDHITDTICNVFGVTQEQLHGTSRDRYLVNARWTAFYLFKKHRGYSTVRIGKMFCKDHTTIMHGLSAIGARMESDEDFKCMFSVAEHRLFNKDQAEFRN